MRLVAGHDQEVAAWASERLGVKFVQPFSALAVADEAGRLRGAAIWNDYHGPGANVELSYLGPVTRSVVHALADYAFNALKVSRVTFKTRKSNKRALAVLQNKRHGFSFGGIKKRYWATAPDGDAIEFVLFRNAARKWLTRGE